MYIVYESIKLTQTAQLSLWTTLSCLYVRQRLILVSALHKFNLICFSCIQYLFVFKNLCTPSNLQLLVYSQNKYTN